MCAYARPRASARSACGANRASGWVAGGSLAAMPPWMRRSGAATSGAEAGPLSGKERIGN